MEKLRLCGLFDVPIRGGRLFESIGSLGLDVLVFRIEGGGMVAYEAQCPHAGALLRPENAMGETLICFLHQWHFKVATGECVTVPGCDLRAFSVSTEGMDVVIELPTAAPG